MILLIDNYDSFVYNLADYVMQSGVACRVVRNDAITIDEIIQLDPLAIILSPGPCTPQQAGISIDLVKHIGHAVPILGVCLGHQAIGEAYGGQTIRAKQPVHGKASVIEHNGKDLFYNLPSPIDVGRYHSLIVALPEGSDLVISALCETGEIMAMQHKTHPVYAVQFHPESVLTPQGISIIKNFIRLARDWHTEQGQHAA